MSPKNSKIGPGMLCTFTKTQEGLQPLYAREETEELEPEEIQWPKENPYIKAAEPAEFTAEMKISPDVAKAFTAFGESCKQAAEALGRFFRAAVDCYVAISREVDISQTLKAAKMQAALNEAPPKVRHLALHGKKYRTQKKNINRALRDYQRRHKNDT